MTTPPSLLGDLEDAIQSGSSERRSEMLRRITDLFINTAPYVTEQQAGVFDDVFEHLTIEIEHKALTELSGRVAAVDNVPARLIRRLAYHEAIEVSGPVLTQSKRLAEDDLVAIARTQSQAHLAAIAERADIGEQVTDVLVERGDMTVARTVAANSGARFSENSLRNLVDRAADDGDLANAIARRRELPPPMFRHLLARATDAVRKRLLDSAPPNTQAVINRILAEISHDVEQETVPERRNYEAAKLLVNEMHARGGIAASHVLQFARTRKVAEMVVALSLLAGIAIEVIDRLLDDPSDDPLLVLCRATDLDWATTSAVLAARLGLPALRDGQVEEVNRRYRKLTTTSAQRVIRFWQAREKLAAAG